MNKTIKYNRVPKIVNDRLTLFKKFMLLLLYFSFLFFGRAIPASAQKIDIRMSDAPFSTVIKELQKKKPDYSFSINERHIRQSKPVYVNLQKVEFEEVLVQIFQSQPFGYKIDGKHIVSVDKKTETATGSEQLGAVQGRVTDTLGNPIADVTVKVLGTQMATATNRGGYFELKSVPGGSALFFSIVGFNTATKIIDQTRVDVTLTTNHTVIDEVNVVNTGYQTLSKERATGSFSTVSNELFNQQVSTDIISRLPAVANSMVADRSRSFGGNGQIMVRGLSTISGPKDPLIILDNFPYDGELNNINPNIVENITILKDASASSIWGARAANGVIVITTKKGQFNKPIRININSNITISNSPDLRIIRQMNTSDFIDVEQELFKKGFYNTKLTSRTKPVISPVVDLLDKEARGLISADELNNELTFLKTIDSRDQVGKYMYDRSVNQQYFISASGGTDKFSWTSAVGYDKNKDYLAAGYDRINLRFQNNYQPTKKISLNTNFYYTQTKTQSGRYGYFDINTLLPYTQIADESGNPLPIAHTYNQSFKETFGNGQLLDWNYHPLTDWSHQVRKNNNSDILGNATLKYEILKGLQASIDYQYQRSNGSSTFLYDESSYIARDYVNRFSQISNGKVTYIIPRGGILDRGINQMDAHSIRGQVSFDNTFGMHNINAIAGVEARTANTESNDSRFYGYDENNFTLGNVDYVGTYPNVVTGANSAIQNNQRIGQINRRFTSQFANAAYTYRDRYVISGSIRRDASNLFGLKTNDQWNPFWSAGTAWKVSNEKFYHSDLISYLNIRATYGFSGNIDPAMVAVNTIRFLPNASLFTGNRIAQFNNYYNPNLRWETSKMLNIATDFRFKNNRLIGSVEYYTKNGKNLFGQSLIDYTTGVDPYMLTNVASMKGSGIDIEFHSLNVDKVFKWNTTLNFSVYKDKTIDYLINRSRAAEYTNTINPPISGIENHSIYSIYAYKWAGLDPSTGDPRGYLNGEVSKDYVNITGAGTSIEDLEYFGSAIPTKFGSFINTFSYKKVNLQIGITYKLGYWFRRSSINYTDLFNNWRGDSDYALRWQKEGDEQTTNVPSNPFTTNSNRDQFYGGSSVLVEKGDHIRLQYINLNYNIKGKRVFKNLQFYLNVNNLGILWKANNADIDPDFNYLMGRFLSPTTFAMGLRTQL